MQGMIWGMPVKQPAPPPAPKPPPPRIATPPPPPRAARPTVYDPSRVIERDRLKLVASMVNARGQENDAERGDTATDDSGHLGPGSDYAFIPPRTTATTEPQNKLTPWLLAAAAYFILGG